MKKIFLIVCIMFCASLGMAQVYVGDSFIYSKGTDIYVKQDINLSTDGEFYLRGEAQLMQGDNSVNQGAGFLSVYQEGTTSNYAYNFWASPVSNPLGTGNNATTLANRIYFPTLMTDFTATGFDSGAATTDYTTDYVIDADIATYNRGSGFSDGTTDMQTAATTTVDQDLVIAGRWLWAYINTVNYSGWSALNSNSATLDTGYGFTMKGVMTPTGSGDAVNLIADGQRYDFRGRPNNGTINVSVTTDNFSLVGNPYPSALDLKQFLIDNNWDSGYAPGSELAGSVIDNELLFWEQNSTSHTLTDYEGGYGVYVPGGVSAADLDANDQYTGTDDGMYTPPTFTRFDTSGNPATGTVANGGTTLSGTTRRYAPIGQGFMISRTSTNTALGTNFATATMGTAAFSNSQRRFFKEDGDLSVFKNSPVNAATTSYVRPKIRLNVKINDSYVRQMILAFGQGATDQLDWGLEGTIDANKQNIDVYMPQYGGEYVIKSIDFDVTKTVDLGITTSTNNSTFEFLIGELENFDTPHIYIHDKYNNTYHDLKNGSYTTILNTGTLEDRFEITFQNTTLSNDDIADEDRFEVVQNNNRKELTVFNPNGLEVKNIAMFDLAGKQIISSLENSTNTSYTYTTNNLSTGIYIVRVTTVDQKETAVKVSVSN